MELLLIPQWFGSGSDDAERIARGAGWLGGRLQIPDADRIDLPGPGPDERVDGIRRWPDIESAERLIRARVRAADRPLLVGGECGIEWGAIGASDRTSTAVVWLDAHADLNTPETSPSGSFHGMVLRRLIDEGLPAGNVVLAGTRDIDPGERATIAAWALPVVGAAEVVERLEAIGPRDVWLHLDVDVIDPSEFGSVGFPVAGGLRVGEVLDLIGAIAARWPFAGAAVTEFSPAPAADDTDLESLVRIVEALRSH